MIRLLVQVLLAAAFLLSGMLSSAPANRAAASALPALQSPGQVGRHPVQIFDITAGKVILTFENTTEFQGFARSWLAGVQGLSQNLSPNDRCGYVFRIPLQQKQPLKVDSLSFQIQEVFLFYCRGKEPELLVFDDRNKPYLLTVTTDVQPFLSRIGLKE